MTYKATEQLTCLPFRSLAQQHVYKQSRRREFERLKIMDEEEAYVSHCRCTSASCEGRIGCCSGRSTSATLGCRSSSRSVDVQHICRVPKSILRASEILAPSLLHGCSRAELFASATERGNAHLDLPITRHSVLTGQVACVCRRCRVGCRRRGEALGPPWASSLHCRKA